MTTSRASANACPRSLTDDSAAVATAYVVGTIVLVKNGDRITIDAEQRAITLDVLAKYAHTVTSASLGAVTDADLKL